MPVGPRLGLCSVTLRHLGVHEVIDTASQAGIEGIEWGSDVHVPDEEGAGVAAALCEEARLSVMSLGTYFRAGRGGDFGPPLRIASALGAPRMRVWAGVTGSSKASATERLAVVGDLRQASERAAESGIQVALEFHNGTLTDTAASALQLLREVDHDNLRLYWQPPLDMSAGDALSSFDLVKHTLAGIHCFSWWPADHRLPLSARPDLWTGVLDRIADTPVDLMLEFVDGDSVQQLIDDAAWCRGQIQRSRMAL